MSLQRRNLGEGFVGLESNPARRCAGLDWSISIGTSGSHEDEQIFSKLQAGGTQEPALGF